MTRSIGAALALAAFLAGYPIERASAVSGIEWIDDVGLQAGLPLLMLPPAAGGIVGVAERRKSDSYTQTLTLRGDPASIGENVVVATVTRDGLAPRIEQNDIIAEMEERLPGIPMAFASPIRQNIFGIFGYALGSRGPLTCFYGWQGVNLADRWISGEDPGLFDEHHALSIRVRLCRTGVSPDALVAMMQGAQSSTAGVSRFLGPMFVQPAGYDALAAAQAVEGLGLGPSAMRMVMGPQPGAFFAASEVRPRVCRCRPMARITPRPRLEEAPLPGRPSVPMPK